MSASDRVFVGIKGSVLALNRADGSILWQTKLKGIDYVALVSEGEEVFGIVYGEVFCLDASTGAIKWHNPLRGWGTSLASLLIPGGQNDTQGNLNAKVRRREEEERARAAATTTS